MEAQAWSIQRYERISQLFGLVIVTIAGAAKVGWFIGSDLLRGIRPNYIPMAPNTALLFLVLGAMLVIFSDRSRKSIAIVRTVVVLAVLLVAARLCEYFISVDLKVDRVFFHYPSESLGLAPVGKMAFFTAVTFLFVGLAFLLATLSVRWAKDASKALSVIVGFTGIAFSLGYLYGAPLMYGSASIPMALNTAICFVLSGSGLLLRGAIGDITERSMAKETLQEAHDELERRVEERTAQLSKAVMSLEAEITERKQAEQALKETEEQLRQSQKLEAVGRLAGGIAHDFNNLLTVIMGYCDMLLGSNQFGEVPRERMEEIKKAAKRASSLTHQLLAFSRKQVLKPELLDLNSLIEGTGNMLRRLIGEDVSLTTSFGRDLGKINADPSQIEQVLINLVVNARDAMPNGGKITIKTSRVELDEAYSDLHMAVKPGRYLMMGVSDTGLGMDAEISKKIFEPFFTTKGVGKGTGLGLSMIYGIVKQSGGNIWVYSEVGRGTTFKIYLPLALDENKLAITQPITVNATRREVTETILLVEDEEMVRKLTRDILEERGYGVLEAKDGEEAVAIATAYRDSIELLLTDVVMPRMNGRDTADAREHYIRLYVSFTCRAIRTMRYFITECLT
jgi:signal transduction histidine kinase